MKRINATKKIRGLRRKTREIDIFFDSIDTCKLEKNISNEVDFYIKLYIGSWYNLNYLYESGKYSIPRFIKLKMLHGLLRLYRTIKIPGIENFYFKVWIFESDFMSSQLVFSSKDKEYYERLFTQEDKKNFTSTFHSMIIKLSKEYNLEQVDYLLFKNPENGNKSRLICLSTKV